MTSGPEIACLITLIGVAAIAGGCASTPPAGPPVTVQEVPTKVPVTDDPLINPAGGKPLPALPAAALAGTPINDEQETGWQAAKWTHATVHVAGTADTPVSVPAPSMVLVSATWSEDVDVTLSVLNQGNSLGSGTPRKAFDGLRSARASVKMTAAGNVLVRATSAGGAPANLDLYIGVLGLATP